MQRESNTRTNDHHPEDPAGVHNETERASAIIEDFLSGTLSLHPGGDSTLRIGALGQPLYKPNNDSDGPSDMRVSYLRIARNWSEADFGQPHFGIKGSAVPLSSYKIVFGRTILW